MSTTLDKISGKTQQQVGKMTGNKKLQFKGKAKETKAKIKSTMNDTGKKIDQLVPRIGQK